jgi:hypothetical protein
VEAPHTASAVVTAVRDIPDSRPEEKPLEDRGTVAVDEGKALAAGAERVR